MIVLLLGYALLICNIFKQFSDSYWQFESHFTYRKVASRSMSWLVSTPNDF